VSAAPPIRVRAANTMPLRPGRDFVLYWMTAARRTRFNYALEHALYHAATLGKPLLVLEALRAGHRHNTARIHRFVMDGMLDNAAAFAAARVSYRPYVEPTVGGGVGLVRALADHACVVVADDFPAYFLPRALARGAELAPVRVEAVDANGLHPIRGAERVFAVARSFRRHLHTHAEDLLGGGPEPTPLTGYAQGPVALSAAVEARWPATPLGVLRDSAFLRQIPVDHAVRPVALRGGAAAAGQRAVEFLDRLAGYAEGRNQPAGATSGLSPYLHFGHLAAAEMVDLILSAEGWHPGRLNPGAAGRRAGFYGLSESAEAFLDQLLTWREMGFSNAAHDPLFDQYAGLPQWARDALERHAGDRRPHLYDEAALDAAATHDEVWNAAQRQLVREGRIHNYLRMLWGKKVLEWSPDPHTAFRTLIHLNDRYAIDGRDPNSYSAISWIFGRYDRPWGPRRPIFGTVRYMSSESTRRKLRLRDYLVRYG
jgi:deoxyribodipyrimidine photo-lyase